MHELSLKTAGRAEEAEATPDAELDAALENVAV